MSNKKRSIAALGEGDSTGRRTRSRAHSGGDEQPSKSFPLMEPFETTDLSTMIPSDLTGDGIKGLSQARYERDLYAIFSGKAFGDDDMQSMHQTWFQSRRPTPDDLWSSKYAEGKEPAKTNTKTIMRTVLTLQRLREDETIDESAPVSQRLAVLHFDYIMLMCLNAQQVGLDEVEYRFPAYKDQFRSLAESLRTEQVQEIPPTSRTSLSFDESIPKATRDMVNSWRVDSKSVMSWSKLAGCQSAKEDIESAVFMGVALPHLVEHEFGWKGILLHGPPGTGKTQLALCVASDPTCTVYHIRSSNIVDKYLGATEKNIRALFTIAQETTPSVIFIDEADAFFSVRESRHAEANTQRLKSEFLSAMTTYSKVVVIGATNLPWALDSAFLRRFDRHVHVGLPSLSERIEILRLKLSECLHEIPESGFNALAEMCDGFTGDTIKQAVGSEWTSMYKKIKGASHFRQVSLNGRQVFCTCSDTHPEAQKLDMKTVATSLYPEHITYDGLVAAIKTQQPRVAIAKAEEQKHLRWGKEIFQEL